MNYVRPETHNPYGFLVRLNWIESESTVELKSFGLSQIGINFGMYMKSSTFELGLIDSSIEKGEQDVF